VKAKHIGLLVGAGVGILWGWLGFKDMVITAVCAFVGWLVVAVLEGEVDVRRVYDNLRRK
jgi:hypothetical protein